MISPSRLADVFVEIADTLVDEYDLVELLHQLTERAAEVSEAEAVGLLLTDHQGRLQFMAASNHDGKVLELFVLQASEGPCWDCFAQQAPVVNVDLTTAGDRASPPRPGRWASGRCTRSRCACARA